MMNSRSYIRYTWFVLVMVFLVIAAGGVVRMTQSGMGCPDWPTCFGRWIPPTSFKDLPDDYEKYLRTQDIDHTFNAYHTWIEYINRLLGALLGIVILIHCIWSFRKFYKTRRSLFWISLFMLIAVGFQGWLGKTVVDANLAVVKITIHMLVALLIAALPVLIITKVKNQYTHVPSSIKWLSTITIILTVIQIILGTEVREQIDEISRALGYVNRETWISKLDIYFLIHRSSSWLVAISAFILCWRSRGYNNLRSHQLLTMLFVTLAIGAGLSMYFLNVPALAQPIHLLSASLLAITLFSFRLHLK